LVTGASGFLGCVLVRRLLLDGLHQGQLRCLVRDVAKAEAVGLPRACLVVGDLRDPGCDSDLRRAAEGVEVVVHLAGSTKAYDRRGFHDVNVQGTRRLLDAVVATAPDAHFVHVSSLAAAGPSLDGSTSTVLADQARTVSNYGESKRLGEIQVGESGLPFTILRPPIVYGPNDAATQLLFRQALALVTAVPWKSRPLSVMHAVDVAEALWLAVQRRPRGVTLPLEGPERTDTHALLRAIAAACGGKARLVRVPLFMAGLAARAGDLWARMRRQPSYFNRDKVREIAAVGWVADGESAREHLGFAPTTTLPEGLREVANADGFAS
jgi:dihydroflavonol-4-reductase